MIVEKDKFTIFRHGHYQTIQSIEGLMTQTEKEKDIPLKSFLSPGPIQIFYSCTYSEEDDDYNAAIEIIFLGIQPLPIKIGVQMTSEAQCARTSKLACTEKLLNILQHKFSRTLDRETDIYCGDALTAAPINCKRKRSQHENIAQREFQVFDLFTKTRKKIKGGINFHKARIGFHWFEHASQLAQKAVEGEQTNSQNSNINVSHAINLGSNKL